MIELSTQNPRAPQNGGHEAPRASRGGKTEASTLTLERLAAMDAIALRGAYESGEPPSLRELDGAPRGRMLAFAGPLGQGRAFETLRRFAASRYFPWEGKSFHANNERDGRGINRVRNLGDWFRFETSLGPSAIDGKPCLVLDYDLSPNPWAIRQIHDELRRVSPRLFLGPAMWKAKPGPRLVLFFAIAID
jgi:hypothetical protein